MRHEMFSEVVQTYIKKVDWKNDDPENSN